MSGKRILFIAHSGNIKDGGEKSFVELIKDAKKRGYRAHVVLPGNGGLAIWLQKSGIRYSLVPYTFWQSPISGRSLINLEAIREIGSIIEQNKVDCVVTNTSVIPWGALAAAITNRPHIWIVREFPFNEFGYLADSYDFLKAYSNTLIANSHQLAIYMQQKLGLKQTKYFYSFVDESKLHLNKEIGHTRLVNIGNIYPRKNQRELIKAVNQLNKLGMSIKLLMIGEYRKDDQYYEELKSLVQQYELSKQVSFVGYHDNPYKLIGPNDISVHSSLSESLGRAVTEAMKLGLVCVGADIQGNREAFALGGGNLYQSGQPKQLARLVMAIVADFENYKAKALKAQERAIKNLSQTACHDHFFVELRKVIGQPNPRTELRHLLTEIDGAIHIKNDQSKTIAHLNRLVKLRDARINDIIESRSWRLVTKIKKLTGH